VCAHFPLRAPHRGDRTLDELGDLEEGDAVGRAEAREAQELAASADRQPRVFDVEVFFGLRPPRPQGLVGPVLYRRSQRRRRDELAVIDPPLVARLLADATHRLAQLERNVGIRWQERQRDDR
jgi:hypothetical protein